MGGFGPDGGCGLDPDGEGGLGLALPWLELEFVSLTAGGVIGFGRPLGSPFPSGNEGLPVVLLGDHPGGYVGRFALP